MGSNYDGSLAKAKEYIKAAKQCGADAVKFQTLRKDLLIAPRICVGGTWVDNPAYRNFRNIELQEQWHYSLKQTADEHSIEFISTPLYLEAVDLLEKVGVRTYKVASGDITFFPLLETIGHTGKRVYLSTGASSLQDVEQAVNILTKAGAGEIVLLHCVSNYPPQAREMNLKALVTLRQTFGLPVGISDHSMGSVVPIAAVALGAVVIEKHVTFDRTLDGPDHSFAIAMEEFSEMIEQIRIAEQSLGTGEKVPTKAELAKQQSIRRGIYDSRTFEPTEDPDGLWLRPEYNH